MKVNLQNFSSSTYYIDISLLKTTHIWLLNFCNNLISIIDKLANYYLNQNRYKKVYARNLCSTIAYAIIVIQ